MTSTELTPSDPATSAPDNFRISAVSCAKTVLSSNFQNDALYSARSEADATRFVNVCVEKVDLGSLLFLQLPLLLEQQTQLTALCGKYIFSLTIKVYGICINPIRDLHKSQFGVVGLLLFFYF